MMKQLNYLMALVFAGASGTAWAIGNFTNSGRVVDPSGMPVAMAMVTYQNPDRSLDYTYTDANGNFTASVTQEVAKPAAASQGATAAGGIVDTLRIGKTGYQPVLVPIKSYSEQIKTVTLAPIDIEAKVNAIMVKHQGDVAWLAGQIYSPAHKEIARRCVRESLVLLKNDSVLPLKRNQRILVVGKAAGIEGLASGGFTRMGRQGDNGRFKDPAWTNIAKGFKEKVDEAAGGKVTQVETIEGSGSWSNVEKMESDFDVIVAVVYESSHADWNGDAGNRSSLEVGYYGGSQTTIDSFTRSAMMKAMIQYHGKVPIVMVMVRGRSQVILKEFIENSNAVVMAWLPGSEGGGVADVLMGDYDFRGKLNCVWPASADQLPLNSGDLGDAKGSGGEPLFPIGFGLRYHN